MFHKFDPVREAVTRGADWLDATYPEWLDRVDVETLNVESCSRCVLGQLFGDKYEYKTGYNKVVDYLHEGKQDWCDFIYKHAFCKPDPEATYEETTNTWRDEINSRRALRAAL